MECRIFPRKLASVTLPGLQNPVRDISAPKNNKQTPFWARYQGVAQEMCASKGKEKETAKVRLRSSSQWQQGWDGGKVEVWRTHVPGCTRRTVVLEKATGMVRGSAIDLMAAAEEERR